MEWFRRHEPARQACATLFGEAARGERSLSMSRINLGEVYYLTAKDYGQAAASIFLEQLRAIPIEIVSVTDADVDAAARLKSRHKISYADGFAATLSASRSAALATGDPDFLPLAAAGILQLYWMGK
jgi:predicted nucleic acid-binding protein